MPKKPDASNPAMALRLTLEDQWRRVADRGLSRACSTRLRKAAPAPRISAIPRRVRYEAQRALDESAHFTPWAELAHRGLLELVWTGQGSPTHGLEAVWNFCRTQRERWPGVLKELRHARWRVSAHRVTHPWPAKSSISCVEGKGASFSVASRLCARYIERISGRTGTKTVHPPFMHCLDRPRAAWRREDITPLPTHLPIQLLQDPCPGEGD
jgi:hypothetical protein